MIVEVKKDLFLKHYKIIGAQLNEEGKFLFGKMVDLMEMCLKMLEKLAITPEDIFDGYLCQCPFCRELRGEAF